MKSRPLNISYFCNQFATRNGTGVTRYSRELFQAISSLGTECHLIPTCTWSDMPQPVLQDFAWDNQLYILPLGRRLTPALWSGLNWPPLETFFSRLDLVHCVFMGYPVSTRLPYVATVHDIGPLTHPQFFPARNTSIMRQALQRTAKSAAKIVCVSQATAAETANYCATSFGIDVSERLVTIGEGVDRRFFQPVAAEVLGTIPHFPSPSVPYLLTAGKISPRKNIKRVVEAFEAISNDVPHHLVIVGGDGWDSEITTSLLRKMRSAARIHFLGYVSEEQLIALYQSADVYIHPSLFEGFGLTILEAMAAGCPVITSNCSSLPEVAGEAAVLVDPHSVEQIAEAALRVLSDADLRARLVGLGAERANTFDWRDIAAKMVGVYREIA
jgi:glycosyltransferase involved in cell wall biosynthesis